MQRRAVAPGKGVVLGGDFLSCPSGNRRPAVVACVCVAPVCFRLVFVAYWGARPDRPGHLHRALRRALIDSPTAISNTASSFPKRSVKRARARTQNKYACCYHRSNPPARPRDRRHGRASPAGTRKNGWIARLRRALGGGVSAAARRFARRGYCGGRDLAIDAETARHSSSPSVLSRRRCLTRTTSSPAGRAMLRGACEGHLPSCASDLLLDGRGLPSLRVRGAERRAPGHREAIGLRSR